jgi:hypothetical protein
VLLAAVQFDQADRRGLTQSLNAMATARQPQPASPRLKRFEQVISTLNALLDRRVAEAVEQARELMTEISLPNFEFEAACNLLALLARLTRHELQLEGIDEQVLRLTRRFAVSKTTTELLVRASFGHGVFEDIARKAYADICAQAEEAVTKSIKGAPGEAVKLLLAGAESSLNAKLIDLALHTIERHHDQIDGADALLKQAQLLHQRYRGYGTQVHLSRASDPRLMTGVSKPG